MLCSMVLAKVWFFFGCKVLMVSGRKLAFAGSWLSMKVAIGCYHHQQLFIMTRMQHFAIIVKTFQVDLTWSKERVRPASSGHHKSQPLPPSSIPAIHSPASQFASFFPLSLDRRSAGCLLVWWGWDPRSLLTERRMVEEEGPRDWEPPGCPTLATPPPTRPPHGPDAASRPSCINDPKYVTNKRCLKFELFWYHAFKKKAKDRSIQWNPIAVLLKAW